MKSKYLSPTIKVVKFKVEQGFQASQNSGFQGNASTDPSRIDFEMRFNDGPRNEQYESNTFGDGFWN